MMLKAIVLDAQLNKYLRIRPTWNGSLRFA